MAPSDPIKCAHCLKIIQICFFHLLGFENSGSILRQSLKAKQCHRSGMDRLFQSGAIFSNFECSWGRKFIPNMRQISRGRGVQNYFENFSAYLCKSQEVPKMFFKDVIFWLKKSYFFFNGEWGIKYFKLKGRQKSLEGRMWPAGRTLAMSDIEPLTFDLKFKSSF